MGMEAANPYAAMFSSAMDATKAPPAGPSEAKSSGTIGGSMFDNSGWNVNFGSGGITSDRTQAPASSSYVQYAIIAVVGLLAWRYLKNH